MKRKTIEEVREIFEKENCKLLSKEYINSKTDLEFICSCGKKDITNLNKFSWNPHCKKCTEKNIEERKKKSANFLKSLHYISYEEVKNIFEEGGCELLSKEFVSSTELLEYICSCGNKSEITLQNFKKGFRCSNCRNRRRFITQLERMKGIKINV